MSRPIASHPSWRSLALVASLLVVPPAIAAPQEPAKKKPVAAAKAGAKAQPVATPKGKGPSITKSTTRKAPAAAAKPKVPVATARREVRTDPKAATTAKAAARAPVPRGAAVAVAPRPEPQMYVPPPLGPERYYPNGVPELRPEFMHPLPSARPQASAQEAMNSPAFTAPQ